MALISNKEMEIFVKIAQGFKGYFLGVVESRAAFREQQEINKDVEDFTPLDFVEDTKV